jgi:hypothetical protein
VLLFTLAVSILSGIFSLAATLRFTQPRTSALKEAGRGAGGAAGRRRTRNSLVVAQVALALTLVRVTLPPDIAADPQYAARTHQSITERLAAIPGVGSVGLSSSITMDAEDNTNPLWVQDVPLPSVSSRRCAAEGCARCYALTVSDRKRGCECTPEPSTPRSG